MSNEELLAQQELLFAKSRAKYAETGGAVPPPPVAEGAEQ